MSLRELSPRSDVQYRKPTRRLSGLVLPVEKVSALHQFVREWRRRELLLKHFVPVRSTILLYGPSGNGKTAIAESMASEMGLPFAVTQCGEIVGSHLGETSRNLHRLFEWAMTTPAVVLFDECDSLLTARADMGRGECSNEMKRAVNTILEAIDGAGKDSVFIFATNFGDKLDAAFLRRMSIQMSIDAPSIEGKRELIRRLRQKWTFIPNGEWMESALQMPSFAECELAVADAARAFLVRENHEGR